MGLHTVLKILQLLCENHNERLQSYIMNQGKNELNLNNLIKIVLDLNSYLVFEDHKFILNYKNLPVVLQGLELLNEMISGCKKNQQDLCNDQFLQFVNKS